MLVGVVSSALLLTVYPPFDGFNRHFNRHKTASTWYHQIRLDGDDEKIDIISPSPKAPSTSQPINHIFYYRKIWLIGRILLSEESSNWGDL